MVRGGRVGGSGGQGVGVVGLGCRGGGVVGSRNGVVGSRDGVHGGQGMGWWGQRSESRWGLRVVEVKMGVGGQGVRF